MSPPSATYRLQLHQGGFAAALHHVEYLRDLGITDCYASPFLAAAAGSNHGYDVIDHARVDPALGSHAELLAFAERLKEESLGLIVDVVPNHMCITSAENTWWGDVLENGPSSPFARYFDIDWDPPKADLKAKVLLPILGDQFGRVIERCEISLRYEHETFVAAYYDTRLPIAPRTWPHILEPALLELRGELGEAAPEVMELESILTSLAHLPLRTNTDRAKVRERQREKEVARKRLAALVADCPAAQRALERSITALNGTPGDPASVDGLEVLLSEQGYRPSFWRVASDEINYRRFFDINELAAVRIEEPAVLRAVHALPLQLAKAGLLTGFRIDHVDGLLLPRRYLQDLHRAFAQAVGPKGPEPYVIVEKILSPGEHLPSEWHVEGTTGYEAGALLAGLLISPTGVDAVRELYQGFTGNREPLSEVMYQSKKLVLRSAMSAELTVLARKLDDISEQHRTSRDFTFNSLREALGELVACFPVYRTYIDDRTEVVGDRDRAYIEQAIAEARRRNPATGASIYDFLRDRLLLDDPPGLDSAQQATRRDFVLRFQQLTSPIMAKGLEDTAFYRHVPLTALNEVGFGGHHEDVTLAVFHRECERRAAEMPLGMSATSTHDTKRGEDVRARLCVLSEIPALWRETLLRLVELARPCKARHHVPDANEEYLLYQTLLGAWPEGLEAPDATFVARIQQYMNKALKEAKLHTSWINPNERYDAEVQAFIAKLLDPAVSAAFLDELARLRAVVAHAGRYNSFTQLVLKLAMPGVPDFYQGSELWDDSLVDPDNRRPVDFELRRRLLAELRRDGEADPAALVERLRGTLADGRLKLWITWRGLALRRAYRDLFAEGSYQPVASQGDHQDRVVAFARTLRGSNVVVACGRHFTAVAEAPHPPIAARWGATTLALAGAAPRRFRDVLTMRELETVDGQLPLREVFAQLPVAMMEELS